MIYCHGYGYWPHIEQWIATTFAYPQYYIEQNASIPDAIWQCLLPVLHTSYNSLADMQAVLGTLLTPQQLFQYQYIILDAMKQPVTVPYDKYARNGLTYRHMPQAKYVGDTFIVESFSTEQYVFPQETPTASIAFMADVSKIEAAVRRIAGSTKKKGGKQSSLSNICVKICMERPQKTL